MLNTEGDAARSGHMGRVSHSVPARSTSLSVMEWCFMGVTLPSTDRRLSCRIQSTTALSQESRRDLSHTESVWGDYDLHPPKTEP